MAKINKLFGPGQTYITKYGATITIDNVCSNYVTYTSRYNNDICNKETASISTEVFITLIENKVLLIDSKANRILYCRF